MDSLELTEQYELQAKNCPNCGAPLTGISCSYCGTEFEVVNNAPTREVEQGIVESDPNNHEFLLMSPETYNKYIGDLDVAIAGANATNNVEGLNGLTALKEEFSKYDPDRKSTVGDMLLTAVEFSPIVAAFGGAFLGYYPSDMLPQIGMIGALVSSAIWAGKIFYIESRLKKIASNINETVSSIFGHNSEEGET